MIDFKLETDSDRKEEIYNQNGYKIEMLDYTNNELPVITDNLGFLYNQTLALFATIRKGQLIENLEFGLDPVSERKIMNSDISGQMFLLSILDELSEMITEFFLENQEIMEYIQTQIAIVEISPEI